MWSVVPHDRVLHHRCFLPMPIPPWGPRCNNNKWPPMTSTSNRLMVVGDLASVQVKPLYIFRPISENQFLTLYSKQLDVHASLTLKWSSIMLIWSCIVAHWCWGIDRGYSSCNAKNLNQTDMTNIWSPNLQITPQSTIWPYLIDTPHPKYQHSPEDIWITVKTSLFVSLSFNKVKILIIENFHCHEYFSPISSVIVSEWSLCFCSLSCSWSPWSTVQQPYSLGKTTHHVHECCK